jgi:nucleotide-binding universal stress UspA family protein
MKERHGDVERILCPVDFSEFSRPALQHALRLARWYGARVEVLHVIPREAPLAGGGIPEPLDWLGERRRHAREELADLVEPILNDGVALETRLLEGEPWRVIVDEAAARCADLLVLGTHGRSGFEHLLLGSVTEKVLRRVSCPVLTVGRLVPVTRRGPAFERILCASALLDDSTRAVEAALSLARENEAQVTLLHVVATLPGEGAADVAPVIPNLGPLRESLVGQARAQLQAAVAPEERPILDVRDRVEIGTPWTEILRAATETQADLIVIGAHTHGAFGRMLFGSTANQVVRRATCPVLVVRETQKAGAYAAPAGTTGQMATAGRR